MIGSWTPDGMDITEVLTQAGIWLRSAITGQGIGAKTGAGYGWFVIDPQAEEERRKQMVQLERHASEVKQKAANEIKAKADETARLASLSPLQTETESLGKLGQQQFAEFAKALPEKTEIQQRAFFNILMTPDFKEDRKRWKRNKPDIWNPIQETAAKLGISLP